MTAIKQDQRAKHAAVELSDDALDKVHGGENSMDSFYGTGIYKTVVGGKTKTT